MNGSYRHADEHERSQFVAEMGSAQNGGLVLTMDGALVHVAASAGSDRVGVTVSIRALADAIGRLRAERGSDDQRNPGTDEDRGRSSVGLTDRDHVPTPPERSADVAVEPLDRALLDAVGRGAVDDVEVRHDSPSVETRAGVGSADAQVEDTVGGRPDTAAAPSGAAVSVVRVEHFNVGPTEFEERALQLLEEIAGRMRPVVITAASIDFRGLQTGAPRDRSSKDRHAGKPRRARD